MKDFTPRSTRRPDLSVESAVRRIQSLIQDLLTHSRLTRDLMPFESVELGTLVSEVLYRFEEDFREKGMRVDVKRAASSVSRTCTATSSTTCWRRAPFGN